MAHSSSQTLYNGSHLCDTKDCGRLITPLEALFGTTCQRCRAKYVNELVKNGMVEPSAT